MNLSKISFCVLLATLATTANPCTLWGASGSSSAEGTLMVKNRDWRPDHVQSLRLVHSAKGYAYVGLFADTGKAPGIKGGVNEKGLSIVSASASSLPKEVREEHKGQHGVITGILLHYRNLDEVAANAQTIFAGAKPMFLMLADAGGLMQVEIAPGGKFSFSRSQNGVLTHTNHYADLSLLSEDQHIGESSKVRLERVNVLLSENKGPHTLAEFARISDDRHDGPDDSLWRNGKEYTLSSWQISLPHSGAPLLHLVMANPDSAKQTIDLQLDGRFWAQSDKVLLGGGAL